MPNLHPPARCGGALDLVELKMSLTTLAHRRTILVSQKPGSWADWTLGGQCNGSTQPVSRKRWRLTNLSAAPSVPSGTGGVLLLVPPPPLEPLQRNADQVNPGSSPGGIRRGERQRAQRGERGNRRFKFGGQSVSASNVTMFESTEQHPCMRSEQKIIPPLQTRVWRTCRR